MALGNLDSHDLVVMINLSRDIGSFFRTVLLLGVALDRYRPYPDSSLSA